MDVDVGTLYVAGCKAHARDFHSDVILANPCNPSHSFEGSSLRLCTADESFWLRDIELQISRDHSDLASGPVFRGPWPCLSSESLETHQPLNDIGHVATFHGPDDRCRELVFRARLRLCRAVTHHCLGCSLRCRTGNLGNLSCRLPLPCCFLSCSFSCRFASSEGFQLRIFVPVVVLGIDARASMGRFLLVFDVARKWQVLLDVLLT
mmetsp:Transcript_9563/g.17111  ORF Transcript_9563/g.17111 Transcript_9563/m.17111 type:complete len:207 (-) Transcript_9563:3280-3900(-)